MIMAMAALLCIIVTANVITMEKTKQDALRRQFEDILTEINNFLFDKVWAHLIRELAITIFNLFIPIMFLSVGAGLAWHRWFTSSPTMNEIKNSPTTNSPIASQHEHNLRPKRQKHFL